MEKDIPCKRNQNKGGVVILISDKVDFKTKANKRQKGSLYNDKGVNLTIWYNICKYLCTNIGVSKSIKQILTGLKEEINSTWHTGLQYPTFIER